MYRSIFNWGFVVVLIILSGAPTHAQNKTELDQMIIRLKDKDESVRLKAAKELGKLKEKAKDAIPALTVAAKSDTDEDVRSIARKSLDSINEALSITRKDGTRSQLEPLLADLKAKQTDKRIAALEKLAELGTLARDAGPDVVEFGVMAKSPDAVRETAVATLEKIDPECHALIMTVLFDKTIPNKDKAMKSLEALGRKGKTSLPALKQIYHQRTSLSGRVAVPLSAMVKIAPDDPETVEIISGLLNQTAPAPAGRGLQSRTMPSNASRERLLAIDLLREIKLEKKKKVSLLIAVLNDPHCRAKAASELGLLGPDAKEALSALTKLKTDPEKNVREAVSLAIDAIKD